MGGVERREISEQMGLPAQALLAPSSLLTPAYGMLGFFFKLKSSYFYLILLLLPVADSLAI